ncbi:hypothetical protein [Sedimentitalea todarodis]|uniref:Sulfotransferase domain-containing protein n=1 Tax=Sedimentitalea todarodis TaxID=1631240 RepID=A0ABU3VK17_9RHOB|nr:hypothetical protein [Sedimentitalea todarodis]MDU9006521.1 hypothetical protein [Sedimentitalea todarodis]
MKLTVHIGTTKTGSSSIQTFLAVNRATLGQAGILVPISLGKELHLRAPLASLPFGASSDLAGLFDMATPEAHAAFRRNTVAAYRNEIAQAPECREVVITSEHLHSRMPKRVDIERFKDLFCSEFSSVRVIVYIRPQLDQITSLYSTVLRGGYQNSLDDFVRSRMKPEFRPYFNIRHIIRRWSGVFGSENVFVRPYKAVSQKDGTLGDFCELLDLDISGSEWQVPDNANTSINQAGQNLLRLVNQEKSATARLRKQVVKWVEKNSAGRGEQPSPDLARAFQRGFNAGNEWVIKTYFPDHPEYLEPRWPA